MKITKRQYSVLRILILLASFIGPSARVKNVSVLQRYPSRLVSKPTQPTDTLANEGLAGSQG